MDDLSSTTIAPMGALASIFAVISILVFSKKLVQSRNDEDSKKVTLLKGSEASDKSESIEYQKRQLEEIFKK